MKDLKLYEKIILIIMMIIVMYLTHCAWVIYHKILILSDQTTMQGRG